MSLTFPCEVTIDVTQEDIDNGGKNNCFRCPIALATARSTGHVCFAELDFIELRNASNQVIARADTPDIASRFMNRYDFHEKNRRYAKPRPIRFALQFEGCQ